MGSRRFATDSYDANPGALCDVNSAGNTTQSQGTSPTSVFKPVADTLHDLHWNAQSTTGNGHNVV